jgi:NAD(P)H-dependent FMN reductase
MSTASILVFAGSVRVNSFNARLAALAAKELTRLDAAVTLISLADYPMPIYDGNVEAESGPPANAVKLKRLFGAQHGIFIASPEYNASVTPLLKNTLDWISRVREGRAAACSLQKQCLCLGCSFQRHLWRDALADRAEAGA